MKTWDRAPPSRADRKAQAIIAAARTHFYRDGYAATSVEAIGRGAGIGKATIYKHFGRKAGLFAAVVAQENREGLDEIRAVLTGAGTLDLRLKRAARILLDLLTAPDFIASYRMVMSEATRQPELAALYYIGAAQLLSMLSDSFATLARGGDLVTPDPLRAAEHFIGLIRGDLQLRAAWYRRAERDRPRHDHCGRRGDFFTFLRQWPLSHVATSR